LGYPPAVFVLALTLTLAAQSSEEIAGRRAFHDPGLGKNGVACSDCHATVKDEEKEGDGGLRAGFSLWGVAKRKFWRADVNRTAHPTLSDAVDVCVQIFQGGQPLEGKKRTDLAAYLKVISPGSAPQPSPKIEPALVADLDYSRSEYRGGDADRGRELFYAACHGCHPHGKVGLGPAIAGKNFAEVARKVREGNGLLRGNRRGSEWSPAYGNNRLSSPQVADIAAFIETLSSR
jgi:mono/diheme cytochrome c family protein